MLQRAELYFTLGALRRALACHAAPTRAALVGSGLHAGARRGNGGRSTAGRGAGSPEQRGEAAPACTARWDDGLRLPGTSWRCSIAASWSLNRQRQRQRRSAGLVCLQQHAPLMRGTHCALPPHPPGLRFLYLFIGTVFYLMGELHCYLLLLAVGAVSAQNLFIGTLFYLMDEFHCRFSTGTMPSCKAGAWLAR